MPTSKTLSKRMGKAHSQQRMVSLSHGEILMLFRALKDRAYQLKVMYHTIDDAKLRKSIWNEMERMEARASELSQAKANDEVSHRDPKPGSVPDVTD